MTVQSFILSLVLEIFPNSQKWQAQFCIWAVIMFFISRVCLSQNEIWRVLGLPVSRIWSNFQKKLWPIRKKKKLLYCYDYYDCTNNEFLSRNSKICYSVGILIWIIRLIDVYIYLETSTWDILSPQCELVNLYSII